MATTGFSADITLTGGLAVDAATNQAVVVNSAAGTVTLVSLGSDPSTALKPVHVTEVIAPSAAPSDPFTQGGIPGANFPARNSNFRDRSCRRQNFRLGIFG